MPTRKNKVRLWLFGETTLKQSHSWFLGTFFQRWGHAHTTGTERGPNARLWEEEHLHKGHTHKKNASKTKQQQKKKKLETDMQDVTESQEHTHAPSLTQSNKGEWGGKAGMRDRRVNN